MMHYGNVSHKKCGFKTEYLRNHCLNMLTTSGNRQMTRVMSNITIIQQGAVYCSNSTHLIDPFPPQRQLRKRKCYLLVAGAVVLTILIIIIAVSARKWDRPPVVRSITHNTTLQTIAQTFHTVVLCYVMLVRGLELMLMSAHTVQYTHFTNVPLILKLHCREYIKWMKVPVVSKI